MRGSTAIRFLFSGKFNKYSNWYCSNDLGGMVCTPATTSSSNMSHFKFGLSSKFLSQITYTVGVVARGGGTNIKSNNFNVIVQIIMRWNCQELSIS